MATDGNAPAPDLEVFRNYLELLARARFDPRLRGKVDPSDLVQQALLRAVAARDRFCGDHDDRAAWLRTILANVMIDAVRKFGRPRGGEPSGRWRRRWSTRRPGWRRSWPPTGPRPAVGRSGTSGCSAWPTPWPGCRRTAPGRRAAASARPAPARDRLADGPERRFRGGVDPSRSAVPAAGPGRTSRRDGRTRMSGDEPTPDPERMARIDRAWPST